MVQVGWEKRGGEEGGKEFQVALSYSFSLRYVFHYGCKQAMLEAKWDRSMGEKLREDVSVA